MVDYNKEGVFDVNYSYFKGKIAAITCDKESNISEEISS